MTREEQTMQAAKDFLPHITNAQLTLFAAGVMWADEHPKEGLWNKEKVIEWIKENLWEFIYLDTLIKYLTKAMEE